MVHDKYIWNLSGTLARILEPIWNLNGSFLEPKYSTGLSTLLPVACWEGSGLRLFCPYWILAYPGRPCIVFGTFRAFSFASLMAHAYTFRRRARFILVNASVVRPMRCIVVVFALLYSSHCGLLL